MSKITISGKMRSPLHANTEATLVKVESSMRTEVYMVTASQNRSQGDWWVYVLREGGWVCVAAIKDDADVEDNDPVSIVYYVEALLR